MTVGDILTSIPVYPESIKLEAYYLDLISSDVKLCEDDFGNVSFINEKSKTEALRGRKLSGRKPYSTVNNNRNWEAFGQSKPLLRWAKEYGINYTTLRGRVTTYGMTLENALTYTNERRQMK